MSLKLASASLRLTVMGLIVHDGAIRYDLDRHRCGAAGQTVTILPPGVPHDGRPAPGASGFRKREIYLDGEFFPARLTGAAVDHTAITDPPLRAALAHLHNCLLNDAGYLDAEAGLALIAERITGHLTQTRDPLPGPEPSVAHRLRELRASSPWPRRPPCSTAASRIWCAASLASSA